MVNINDMTEEEKNYGEMDESFRRCGTEELRPVFELLADKLKGRHMKKVKLLKLVGRMVFG